MRILVVDDELSMRELLELMLQRHGYEVMVADGVASAKEALQDSFDLVITDMKLKNGSGLTVVKAARSKPMPPEVIVITAYGTPASAIEAIREGAYDYITKPFDNEEFRLLVQRALEKSAMRRENLALRQTLREAGAVVGPSPAMQEIWAMVDKVAAAPRATVLVSGESGTGKELVARAIHTRSVRGLHPFIPVNCAAIPEALLESELFGHVKGAFTGAVGERSGLLASAGQGSVFLDEIGEISPAVQVKLLRALQERKVRPVGSTAEISVEARVIAATNKDLEEEVKEGRFREDLLYRLNVINVQMPALRERREDIPVLARHFLESCAEELGRPSLHFAPATLELLSAYRFPGNVRQLQNIVERAATLAEEDEIGPSALPPVVRGEREEAPTGSSPIPPSFSLEKFLDDAERRYLHEALRLAGSKVKAAQLLGLSFRSFRYRLAKHGLEEPDVS